MRPSKCTKNITGNCYGKLTAVEFLRVEKYRAVWLCKCSCGKYIQTKLHELTAGSARSCGCSNRKDLLGKIFGRLSVLKYVGYDNHAQSALWKCQCECGKKKIAASSALLSGSTVSCGCKNSENKARFLVHGNSKNKCYAIWSRMMSRCYLESNISFKNYGGRGISVCDEWHDFEKFFIDMGLPITKDHSLERLNNNIGYNLDNCKWATSKEQNRNKRNNFIIFYQGKRKCLAEWCEILNIDYGLAHSRLRYRGWSAERAFSTN